MNKAKIDRMLAKASIPYEIIKGNGYYWFCALDGAPLEMDNFMGDQSIFMNAFHQASDEWWINHITKLIEEYRTFEKEQK